MSTITVSNTDTVCVAIRTAGINNNKDARIKTIMDITGMDEPTAKRFEWFCRTVSATNTMCNDAVAAAWVANEEFGRDGVNSPEDAFEIALALDECECVIDPEDGSTIQHASSTRSAGRQRERRFTAARPCRS